MPFLIALGAIILFFVFLLLLKFTLTIAYKDEVELWVRVLFVKIRLVPARKKRYPRSMSARKAARLKKRRLRKLQKKLQKKRQKEEEKDQERKDLTSGKARKEKKTPGEILDVISLVCSLITKVVGKFFRHLRIKLARINIKIATGDAATTAVTYGAVTGTLNVVLPLLDSLKTVKAPKAKQINVWADFCSDETEIDICVSFSLRVWHLLHVGILALVELIKYFFKSAKRKDEEGGEDGAPSDTSESNEEKLSLKAQLKDILK